MGMVSFIQPVLDIFLTILPIRRFKKVGKRWTWLKFKNLVESLTWCKQPEFIAGAFIFDVPVWGAITITAYQHHPSDLTGQRCRGCRKDFFVCTQIYTNTSQRDDRSHKGDINCERVLLSCPSSIGYVHRCTGGSISFEQAPLKYLESRPSIKMNLAIGLFVTNRQSDGPPYFAQNQSLFGMWKLQRGSQIKCIEERG